MENLHFYATMLWPYVMAIMILMIVLRIVFLVMSLIKTGLDAASDSKSFFESVRIFDAGRIYSFFLHLFLNLLRSFLPGYKIFPARPFYLLHRIVFHLCLFVCVFSLSYHIYIWEETLPQWILSFLPAFTLPDELLEYAALFVIFSVIYMFLKRWILKDMRLRSGPFDFVLSLVVLIPFVSGYYAMTDMGISIAFIDYNLDTIHILSGDIFILAACFLFCRTVITKKRCVACLACVNSCPAGALGTLDIKEMRHIHYIAGNCIHCGTCMAVCEDRASELRHVPGIPWPGRQKELFSAEMSACKTCNTLFVTQKQLEKLQQKNIDSDLSTCPECRQFSHAKVQRNFIL